MARQGRHQPQDIEWNFYSFPVLFGFLLGAFIATLLLPFSFFVFIISLFGVSFCTAHAITHWLRRRSTAKARDRAEEDERERRALAARRLNSQQGAEAAIRRRRRRR